MIMIVICCYDFEYSYFKKFKKFRKEFIYDFWFHESITWMYGIIYDFMYEALKSSTTQLKYLSVY